VEQEAAANAAVALPGFIGRLAMGTLGHDGPPVQANSGDETGKTDLSKRKNPLKSMYF
jgi:hypothetical protein